MKNVTKNIGFVFLLTALGVLYISNAHRAERKLRKIDELQKDVEDAKMECQEVWSDITYKSTESQLADNLESQGFESISQSPIVVKVSDK